MLAADFHKLLRDPEQLNEATLPLLKELVARKPAFQLGWMLLLKNLKIVNSPEFEAYLAKGAFYVADRRKLYHYLMIEGKKAVKDMDQLAGEYLSTGSYQIEQEADPQESLSDLVKSLRRKNSLKPATLNENEDNSGERNESPEFVTETLAKIYMRQGMYKQAILAYEKLSLKYPEKNIYFAGQIDEVKKLMN
ncbi:hypothetical protein [Mangrovibacterium diazotrophicum]|uniref:Tetratricopeptide repeat protein n=1 Tax=Mangrovibacterium diazotrophicum TaxID=1261403 RepID=A0A419W7T2_9BACT|nr:hypothetical protein [Mangrovibacterium diazotrophicum]RKD91537.1 hypothetical protein BC643_1893 [Mangrovibacterium diazotrophicum]